MVVSTSCMLVHSSWSQYRYLAQVFCKLALVPAGTLLLVRGDMLIGFFRCQTWQANGSAGLLLTLYRQLGVEEAA